MDVASGHIAQSYAGLDDDGHKYAHTLTIMQSTYRGKTAHAVKGYTWNGSMASCTLPADERQGLQYPILAYDDNGWQTGLLCKKHSRSNTLLPPIMTQLFVGYCGTLSSYLNCISQSKRHVVTSRNLESMFHLKDAQTSG